MVPLPGALHIYRLRVQVCSLSDPSVAYDSMMMGMGSVCVTAKVCCGQMPRHQAEIEGLVIFLTSAYLALPLVSFDKCGIHYIR